MIKFGDKVKLSEKSLKQINGNDFDRKMVYKVVHVDWEETVLLHCGTYLKKGEYEKIDSKHRYSANNFFDLHIGKYAYIWLETKVVIRVCLKEQNTVADKKEHRTEKEKN